MNSSQELERLCNIFKIPLISIFSKDDPPSKKSVGAYIVNLEDHDAGGGTHWCCFVITDKSIVYFDPFGINAPSQLQHWFNKPYIWNSKQIQDVSRGYCGLYCVLFLKYIYNNKKSPLHIKLKQFINIFYDDTSKNERVLKVYFPHLIKCPIR